jgi:hypothetical protein
MIGDRVFIGTRFSLQALIWWRISQLGRAGQRGR